MAFAEESDPLRKPYALREVIHAVSIDSRNRVLRASTTPSDYAVVLPSPVEHVTTVQLGDIALPADARPVIDGSRHVVRSLDSWFLPDAQVLHAVETETTFGSPTISSYTSNAMPPTVNSVTGVSGNTITFAQPHGLDYLSVYYTDSPPVLLGNTNTLNTWLPIEGTAVMAPLNATQTQWNLADPGSIQYSGLYYPPVMDDTAAKLVQEMLNSLQSPYYSYTFNYFPEQSLCQVVAQSKGPKAWTTVDPSTGSRVQRTVTARLVIAEGDPLWRFGFPTGVLTFPASTKTLQFPLRFPFTNILPTSSPSTGDALAKTLSENTGGVAPPTSGATWSFYITAVDGSRYQINMPLSYFTGQDAAEAVTQEFAHLGIGANYRCIFDPVESTFLFDCSLGPFVLDFSDSTVAANADLARVFGFSPKVYSGAMSYGSTQPACVGGTNTTVATRPVFSVPLSWQVDGTNASRLDVQATDVEPSNLYLHYQNSLSPWLTALVVRPDASVYSAAPRFQVGDVVTITDAPHGFSAYAVITGSRLRDYVPTSTVALQVTLRVFGTDSTDFSFYHNNEDYRVQKVMPPIAFGLLGAGQPRDTSAYATDVTAGRTPVSPYTIKQRRYAEVLGSLYDQIGLDLGAVYASAGSADLVLPCAFSLEAPSVIYLQILEPVAGSVRHTFLPINSPDQINILAKLIVTNGYARITEDATHVTLPTAQTVSRLHFRFLNPDGSLCDFQCRDNCLTILMRASEGEFALAPNAYPL